MHENSEEPTGVMQQLTSAVLDRVVGRLAEWKSAGDPAARRSERKRVRL